MRRSPGCAGRFVLHACTRRLFLIVLLFGVVSATWSQTPRPRVAAGPKHAVAVLSNGTVMTWGENEVGQLGRGTTGGINEQFAPEVLPGIDSAVDVAVGEDFTLLVLADGTVLSWGENRRGQLGLGEPGVLPREGVPFPKVHTPTRIPGLKGVRQVAAGLLFGLALLDDGTVVAWGDGKLGALGDGKGTGSGGGYRVPFPRPVEGLRGVRAIAAGNHYGLALMEDGTVRGWGANEYGQMGDEAVDFKALPVVLGGLQRVRSIHAGARTAFAVLDDGATVVWGRNDCNLFGVSEQKVPKTARPLPVQGLGTVRQLSVSDCHVIALLEDGTVRGWGHNGFGQLGLGHKAEYPGGFGKPKLFGVAAVFAGGARSYFLLEDGSLLIAGFKRADETYKTPTAFLVLR